ncbi:MAG: M42 family peptidase [Ruminococcus sp.]|jgi:endoglucanase|nr:M42 family peptidase [Ruminococcus sp.]
MLKTLCDLYGGSGDEKAVRDYIISEIKDFADEIKIDNIGNIIAVKKGKKAGKPIVIGAHMDEVGFIITHIADDGTLGFSPVGGIEPSAAAGKRVRINGLCGVIGVRAMHNLTAEERSKTPKFEALRIDIGAEDKKQAESFVKIGDRAYFEANFKEIGGGKIISKAIDDRFGCAVLINILKSELPYDCTFAFFSQEEVGCRGSKAAKLTADYAIIAETTTAADFDGVENEKQCCKLGGGAVISYMDRATVYDSDLFALAMETADKNHINRQTKTLIAGGNDSSSVNIKNGGIKTAAVSLPCRCLHTGATVADKEDIKSTAALIEALFIAVNESEI